MEYHSATGICLVNEIASIKKKNDAPLHPVFEALVNSFEAIRERFGAEFQNGRINITFAFDKQDTCFEGKPEDKPERFLKYISVQDNGAGLSGAGRMRLVTLRDTGKGSKNKGTGRVQFVHFFDETHLDSRFLDEKNENLQRSKFILSKKAAFIIAHNAILGVDIEHEKCEDGEPGTLVTFFTPLDKKDKDWYVAASVGEVKKCIINHFLACFCDWRDNLPKICINQVVDAKTIASEVIVADDIPKPYREGPIVVNYSKMDAETNRIVDIEQSEDFKLRGFKIDAKELEKNEILLVSKGETAKGIGLDDIRAKDVINDCRYLFLLSGDYIDSNDTDTRGNINLVKERDLKAKQQDLFDGPVILQERLENAANAKIRELCVEIGTKKQEQDDQVEKLAKMFLLNQKTVEAVRGKLRSSDTDETILQKIYEAESVVAAQKDAEIKKSLENIDALRPEADGYQDELKQKTMELVRSVPLQDRNVLSQYVARRKIVLELLGKILTRELERYKNGESIDENVLHNLIFRQHSDDPASSDLWLINEELIYFKGGSEKVFKDIEYKGKKIISEDLPQNVLEELNAFGERRLDRRPDILLFPEEGKCLIIEFKAPDVNVAKHLQQIDSYANILLNYSKPEFKFTRFYGYLIGESVSNRDIRSYDSDYICAPASDYWYRNDKKVAGFDGRRDGNLHMEILKYSALLNRAIIRNRVFIEKLGLNVD